MACHPTEPKYCRMSIPKRVCLRSTYLPTNSSVRCIRIARLSVALKCSRLYEISCIQWRVSYLAWRHLDGGLETSVGEQQHNAEPGQQERVVEQKIRMVENEDGHPHRASDDHVDEVDQEHGERPLHEYRFHEMIGVARLEAEYLQMRNLLSHSDGDPGEEPPFQHFHCIVLQRAERAHEEQRGNHDAGEGDDRDRLDGERERVVSS